jgi:hypothetical protein
MSSETAKKTIWSTLGLDQVPPEFWGTWANMGHGRKFTWKNIDRYLPFVITGLIIGMGVFISLRYLIRKGVSYNPRYVRKEGVQTPKASSKGAKPRVKRH